jgi:hypothetical protein
MWGWRNRVTTLLVVLIAFSAMAIPAAADYEPNDTLENPFGPLANQQSYIEKLETANDKDFFYFYATAPTQVAVTLKNLGGGVIVSYIGFTLLDASGVALATATNIEEGEQATLTADLTPQKYYVEVVSNLDYGAQYVLETQGGEGAFGPYAAISHRCAKALAAAKSARIGLTRAESKLQRATARLRRSRFGNRASQRAAEAAHHKAKARTRVRRHALSTALKSQRPWCQIAA